MNMQRQTVEAILYDKMYYNDAMKDCLLYKCFPIHMDSFILNLCKI